MKRLWNVFLYINGVWTRCNVLSCCIMNYWISFIFFSSFESGKRMVWLMHLAVNDTTTKSGDEESYKVLLACTTTMSIGKTNKMPIPCPLQFSTNHLLWSKRVAKKPLSDSIVTPLPSSKYRCFNLHNTSCWKQVAICIFSLFPFQGVGLRQTPQRDRN